MCFIVFIWYPSDTHLIPFCNPTLQKGIRWVSERYQKVPTRRGFRQVVSQLKLQMVLKSTSTLIIVYSVNLDSENLNVILSPEVLCSKTELNDFYLFEYVQFLHILPLTWNLKLWMLFFHMPWHRYFRQCHPDSPFLGEIVVGAVAKVFDKPKGHPLVLHQHPAFYCRLDPDFIFLLE